MSLDILSAHGFGGGKWKKGSVVDLTKDTEVGQPLIQQLIRSGYSYSTLFVQLNNGNLIFIECNSPAKLRVYDANLMQLAEYTFAAGHTGYSISVDEARGYFYVTTYTSSGYITAFTLGGVYRHQISTVGGRPGIHVDTDGVIHIWGSSTTSSIVVARYTFNGTSLANISWNSLTVYGSVSSIDWRLEGMQSTVDPNIIGFGVHFEPTSGTKKPAAIFFNRTSPTTYQRVYSDNQLRYDLRGLTADGDHLYWVSSVTNPVTLYKLNRGGSLIWSKQINLANYGVDATGDISGPHYIKDGMMFCSFWSNTGVVRKFLIIDIETGNLLHSMPGIFDNPHNLYYTFTNSGKNYTFSEKGNCIRIHTGVTLK